MSEINRITEMAKSVGAENPRTPCARGSQDISEKDSMKMLKEKLIVQERLILDWDKDHLSDRNCIESIKELWATSQKELLAVSQAILAKHQSELDNKCIELHEETMMEMVSNLKAQLAMQADELTAANGDSKLWDGHAGRYCKSLNATAEDVAKYKAEIEASVLEEAALIFEGATPFNWCASDGYPNGLEVATELRLLASERGGVR